MTIVVDPGHGGTDPGAIGPTRLRECDVALAVARHVERGLAATGHKVMLTRRRDHYVSLRRRAWIANDARADLFVSIHCNAFTSDAAHGMEVWTSRGDTGSDRCADALLAQFAAAFPDLRQRRDFSDGDGDKEAGFVVLTQTKMPAVLVELAFISHVVEEAMLRDLGTQRRFASAIVGGITEWERTAQPLNDHRRI